MSLVRTVCRRLAVVVVLTATAVSAGAQQNSPPPRPPLWGAPLAPGATPPSTVSSIRNKLAAGDLPSAESILEVHVEKYGEDPVYLNALGWVARGAFMLGDAKRARMFADLARALVKARLESGEKLEGDLETALGAAVEVQAQCIARAHGAEPAVRWVQRALAEAPSDRHAYRSRLWKRIDLLSLVGQPAPELEPELVQGEGPHTLAALRGRPVVLFGFAEWCGDCKAQAAALEGLWASRASDHIAIVALTRHYENGDSARAAETVRADSVWAAVYPRLKDVPRVFSTESMERYGVSATPTFVFIDRKGIVRHYAPTRLTAAELDRWVTSLLR